tara:strand:- start:143 stop:382 length:240 start_codon:yes stop_codon:yes gene_type:complete
MEIVTIGWVWLGIVVGMLIGIILNMLISSNKNSELEAENLHLRFVRDSLKEEIFRLDNQVKPKPRNKRSLKAKSIKIGK